MIGLAYALGIALAVVALASVTSAIVQARTISQRTEQLMAAGGVLAGVREDLGAKTVELERKTFELQAANTALATERARSKALEDYVASVAAVTDPNADLAPDDVESRLLRLSRELGTAAAEAHPGSPVRRGPEPAVPPVAAPAPVPGTGPDDLLRPE